MSGELDIAFNAGTDAVPDGIEVQRLISFPRRLWAHSQNAILDKQEIAANELSGKRVFIYEYDYSLSEFRAFLKSLEECGTTVERIHEMEAIRRLVQADVGMCILSDLSYELDRMISKNVATLSMTPAPPPFEVSVFKLRKKDQSAAAVSFLGHLLSRIL